MGSTSCLWRLRWLCRRPPETECLRDWAQILPGSTRGCGKSLCFSASVSSPEKGTAVVSEGTVGRIKLFSSARDILGTIPSATVDFLCIVELYLTPFVSLGCCEVQMKHCAHCEELCP